MSLADYEAMLDDLLANSEVRRVSLTGGEPFCVPWIADLFQAGWSRGIETSVVTNAFWATGTERAKETLRTLRGLRKIVFSLDPFHAAELPSERVHDALRAARELGVEHAVRVSFGGSREQALAWLLGELPNESEDSLAGRFEYQPLVTAGGASALSGEERGGDQNPMSPDHPCLVANRPIVLRDGRVLSCCSSSLDLPRGNPLEAGRIGERSLSEIIQGSNMDPVVQLIRVHGPAGLQQRLEEAGVDSAAELRAVHPCDLCKSIMEDAQCVAGMEELRSDPAFCHDVAFRRLMMFDEDDMLTPLALGVSERDGHDS